MTGRGDEELFESIREAYRDIHLSRPLADISSRRTVMAGRTRVVLVAAVTVMVITIGTWLVLASGGGQTGPLPPDPPASTSPATAGKPPRPSSSATTDAGRCADYGQATVNSALPPLRLTLSQAETRFLLFATDDLAVTCWLSGDVVVVQGSPTAVNAETYPPGRLSYSSEDSGHGFGGVAFGRVPPGTTEVTISFPTGPDVVATVMGEWFAYSAPPGPDNDRLADATTVTAVTPTGNLSQPIQHG